MKTEFDNYQLKESTDFTITGKKSENWEKTFHYVYFNLVNF